MDTEVRFTPTPGPWQVVPEGQAEHRWVVGDHEGGSVASCEPMGPWMSYAEADSNARLIAAAPDLLAALHEAQAALAMLIAPDAIKTTSSLGAFAACTAAEAKARAAIAKAEAL